MAYISINSTTETSIGVRVAGLDTTYAKADRTCAWYINGTYKSSKMLGAKVSSGGTYTFSGLRSGTTYDIMAVITAPGWTITVTLEETATTDETLIDPWNWNASNGAASSAQTRAAYNAVSNRGSIRNFSYLVWNDMVDKVYEVLSLKDLSWNTRFASYAATKMTSGNKKLSAERFNSLRYNIGIHYSTDIDTVSRGQKVYGWYFIRLADCINGWINE